MEYLKLKDIIVISDLHIGIEMEFATKGIFIPWQVDKLKEKIRKILKEEKDASKIIINGDLKHSILRPDRKEIKYVFDFLNFLEEYFDEVIIVKGNHDGKLQKILKGRTVVPYYLEKNTLFIHGHKRIPKELNPERIVIGHIHPIFKHELGAEKVFVRGFLDDVEVIILPAFSDLVGGRDPRDGMKGPIAKRLRNIEIISLEGDLLWRNF